MGGSPNSGHIEIGLLARGPGLLLSLQDFNKDIIRERKAKSRCLLPTAILLNKSHMANLAPFP